ncbi:hypothetical protein RSOL_031330 [Rhizoctonia solani AG-3 Rhs1AP]|uniref:DUF7587 domain-containing protein n=2 Tax=Rhizoctonia solani AG-3 TaxID=1086053 RepID=A0A074RF84_9AGAM|nr:hypothetical protein RSOL_031330 [Rhizoctonia solani AG-3 Rhs1AP]KEP45449.1 hypothetical protein V565_272690 [Rhizoctonia solani 123E]
MLPDLKTAHRLVERVESTRLVFRVFDNNSHQSYSPSTGFNADTDVINPSDLNSVKRSVEKRISFYNQSPTPWISTTRRWLWAVWEANRRSNRAVQMNHPNPNVRIAIIDLDACLNADEGTSIPSLGYNHLPFIYALSGLSSAEINSRRFADMADEILIYQKVPPSAVISIWQFDSGLSSLPRQFTHSLPPSVDSEWAQGFRANHELVVDQFLQDWHNSEWDASRVGESCATVALVLLHDAYVRIAGEVGEVVKSAWSIAAWKVRTPTRRSVRIINRAREDGNSNQRSTPSEDLPPFPETFVESLAHKVIQEAVNSKDPFCRDTIEEATTAVIMCTPCETDSRRSTYERFLTHKKSLMAQIMNHVHANALSIQIRRIRRKVDRFHSIALELARTVPLGLLDELHVTRVDWETMKCHMLRVILTKLAPLCKKLDVHLIEPIPRNELVGQSHAHNLEAEAQWLSKEIEYPLWWEQCGMQKSMIEYLPDARAWPESLNRVIE